jgi:hypothetical protein
MMLCAIAAAPPWQPAPSHPTPGTHSTGRSDDDGLGTASLLMSADAGGEVQRRNQVGHHDAR